MNIVSVILFGKIIACNVRSVCFRSNVGVHMHFCNTAPLHHFHNSIIHKKLKGGGKNIICCKINYLNFKYENSWYIKGIQL